MKNSNSLQTVSEIKKLHSEILDAARGTLDKAIKIGELLSGIKAGLKHGEWLPWLKANLTITERTAQNYARCFEEKDRLKSANVSDLSGAYLLLSEPKNEESRAERAARLDAIVNGGIVAFEEIFSLLPKPDLADPLLDAPMDAKTFFDFILGEPQDTGNLICDTLFKAVIGLRFSKGGKITRREINYLREKCNDGQRQFDALTKE
jgi:hypothetical protein